jgi:hypothetical protein
LIEAFVSPTGLAIPLKFSMAGALFVLLGVYLFGMARKPSSTAEERRVSAA